MHGINVYFQYIMWELCLSPPTICVNKKCEVLYSCLSSIFHILSNDKFMYFMTTAFSFTMLYNSVY